MLGRRGRPPTLSPPRNYRRRLNGQDEQRGENLCASEDEYQHEDESRSTGRGEEERGECRDGFDLIADEDHDAGHASDASDYANRRGERRGRGRQKKKKKCASRGAAAPSPWIVDPRPCAEEGSVNDNDLREEEFFPSPQLEREVNEEGQEIGCFSLPEPKNQVLHYPGYHFVLDLVLACRSFIANPSNENNAVLKIFQFLNSTDHGFTESQQAVMAFDSLENLAARCSQAEENIGVTHFIFMLNAIQLRCKVIRFAIPISCLV